jgi:hypothetical protein
MQLSAVRNGDHDVGMFTAVTVDSSEGGSDEHRRVFVHVPIGGQFPARSYIELSILPGSIRAAWRLNPVHSREHL